MCNRISNVHEGKEYIIATDRLVGGVCMLTRVKWTTSLLVLKLLETSRLHATQQIFFGPFTESPAHADVGLIRDDDKEVIGGCWKRVLLEVVFPLSVKPFARLHIFFGKGSPAYQIGVCWGGTAPRLAGMCASRRGRCARTHEHGWRV